MRFELFSLAAVSLALAQPDPRQAARAEELPPSPLEAFAARPTAKVVLSKTIGRFDSRISHATLTVVVVEDQANPNSEMRSLRIDLRHDNAAPACDWKYTAWQIMCQRPNAAVYIEEARLEKVRDQLNRGVAELRPMEFISQYEGGGAGYSVTGLIICGYDFPDRQATQLAELLKGAIAELTTAAR